jgi:hypothetical protein
MVRLRTIQNLNSVCFTPPARAALLSRLAGGLFLVLSFLGTSFCQGHPESPQDLTQAVLQPSAASNGSTLFSLFSVSPLAWLNHAKSGPQPSVSLRAMKSDPLAALRSLLPCPECGLPETGLDEFAVDPGDSAPRTASANEAPEPLPVNLSPARDERSKETIQWRPLIRASTFYLGVMHGWRIATEPSTRAGLHNSVFGGYSLALGAMHGWSDGDGYFVNYLGHPIEGAVAAYIWIDNDPKYRTVEFGKKRDYWMSRFRAYAYAWAFSEQFEIGLTSEASIGQIQRYCCGYGFVDHVITPNAGMVWVIGGDILDRYVVRPIEEQTTKALTRALVRSLLNPPLAFANVMALKYPWHRENRPGVHAYQGELYPAQMSDAERNPSTLPYIPRFEVFAAIPSVTRYGSLSCPGGGGIAGLRVSDSWQWTAEVGGCTLGNNRPKGWSGDSLTFMTGPRWVLHTDSRWSPYFHTRIGGQKITQDYCLKYGFVHNGSKLSRPCESDPTGSSKHYEGTGVAMSTGAGVDLRINRALEVLLANFDYLHSWLGPVAGTDFSHGLRFSFGLGLKLGTW